MPVRSAAIRLLLAALLPLPALPAQEAAPRALARLAEVAERALDPALANALVTLRGVVTHVEPERGNFSIQDASGGVQCSLAVGGRELPAMAAEVEVTGRLVVTPLGVTCAQAALRTLGPGRLPEPVPATVHEVLTGRHDRLWVELEGVILQASWSAGFLWLHLAGTDGWCVARVGGWNGRPIPADWWGARVRVRGANIGSGPWALRVTSFGQVEFLQGGRSDPFAAPLLEAAAWARQKPDPARIRVRARVLGEAGGRLLLRAGELAFMADWLQPYEHEDVNGQYQAYIGIPRLQPGDTVELVGSLLQTEPVRWLRFVQGRRLEADGRVPEAHALPLAQIVSGAGDADRVHTEGRLVQRDRVLLDRGARELLTLEQGGRRLAVRLDSAQGDRLAHLRPDERIEVTGLVVPEGVEGGRWLQLPNAEAARSLGPTPEARRRERLRLAGGGIGLLAAAGLVVVILLRKLRQAREREAELARVQTVIRELNAGLEKRVEERTAELEKAHADLHRALEQERELGELKSRFVTLVSHEFRTPLGIIMSAVELMRHYDERLPEEQKRELLEDIYRSTRLMAGLMEQVLVLGRVEAGRTGCRAVPVELDAFAGRLIDEIQSATHRRCGIVWQSEGGLAGARADEALLRHILGNLLSNAVKYSPEGAEVRFSGRRDGREAVFEVADRGIGIPAAEVEHLFDAFYRCSNVGETPGTGLGLLIVKRCVELHGGRIELASDPGSGTIFTVRLPLFAEEAAQARAGSAE